MIAILTTLAILFSGLGADCVNKDGVKLRSKRSIKAPVTWQVRKYLPLIPVGKDKNKIWTKVRDMDGDIHWVQKKDITKEYNCLAVKMDGAQIKTEPMIDAPDKYTEPTKKYDTFKFLGATKGWINVEDTYGDTGWIQYEYVYTD